jgi:hypothetical protein
MMVSKWKPSIVVSIKVNLYFGTQSPCAQGVVYRFDAAP